MKNKARGCSFAVTALMAVGSTSDVGAITPRLIRYQGLVENASGPIDNQTLTVEFRAFDSLEAGLQRGATVTRNLSPTELRRGVFSVEIDADELGLPDSADETFLELAVCSPSPCSPVALSPRSRVTHAALAVSARSLGAAAYPGDDSSLRLRASTSGSALLRTEGTGSVPLRLESSSENGDRTVLAIDELERSVSVFHESALAAVTAGITVPPRLSMGIRNTNVAYISAYDGSEPATLQINAGDEPALEIDGATRAAKFYGPQGISAARLIVNSAQALGRDAAVMSGSSPVVEFVVSVDGNLELKVDEEVVDRWTPVGDTPYGAAPNRISGSVFNQVDPGVFGAVILGGGAPPGEGADQTGDLDDVCNRPSEEPCVDHGNRVTGPWGTVAGGVTNTAGNQASVGGGTFNLALETFSTIAGGDTNRAVGYWSTVSGGFDNRAVNALSMVPGGYNNSAAGNASFAGGTRALVSGGNHGTFVWADAQGLPEDPVNDPIATKYLASSGENQFIVRAAGGIWFGTSGTLNTVDPPQPREDAIIPPGHFIETSTGAYLSSAGVWTDSSDRDKKENFEDLNRRAVLARVVDLPISAWNFKDGDPSIRHIGPVAQDFHAAFGVGEDDKHIAPLDTAGVALAAIQGLYEIVEERDCRIDELEGEKVDLEARVAALETMMKNLLDGAAADHRSPSRRQRP